MATNPLTELIPAQYRRYVYLVAAAALLVYGIWEASGGDVRAFVVALVSSLVSGLAASNTNPQVDVEGLPEDAYYDGHGEV